MSDAVDRALSENHALIAAILEHHTNNRPLPAVALLERVQINLEFVAAVAEHGVPLAPPPTAAPPGPPPPPSAPPVALAPQTRIAPTAINLAPAPPANVPLAPAPQPQPQQQNMYWSTDEHARFEQAMRIHGDKGKDGKPDFKAIATMVGSRTPVQVRTHLQKMQKRNQNGEGPVTNDADAAAVSNASATAAQTGSAAMPATPAPTRSQAQPSLTR